MSARAATDHVRAVIVSKWPARFEAADLDDESVLGGEGLGLDSVEIAELLLTCEDESGVPMPDTLLTEEALTIVRVARCFWGAT